MINFDDEYMFVDMPITRYIDTGRTSFSDIRAQFDDKALSYHFDPANNQIRVRTIDGDEMTVDLDDYVYIRRDPPSIWDNIIPPFNKPEKKVEEDFHDEENTELDDYLNSLLIKE